jgi:hypothetical protein
MKIDVGFVVILAAALLFYLRLILMQRERARRPRQAAFAERKAKNKRGKAPEQDAYARLSILSTRKQDWLIAGIGVLAVALGVLFNQRLLPWQPGQAYWWLPVALGILMFSWAFR